MPFPHSRSQGLQVFGSNTNDLLLYSLSSSWPQNTRRKKKKKKGFVTLERDAAVSVKKALTISRAIRDDYMPRAVWLGNRKRECR